MSGLMIAQAQKTKVGPDTATPLLQVRNLSVHFMSEGQRFPAVEDVSFDIFRGEIVGLVGESGSGKTVTGMSLLRLIPQPPGCIAGGTAVFDGRDLLQLPLAALRRVRGREIGVIFQEPMTALSPLHTVGRQLVEAQRIHFPERSQAAAWAEAANWLTKVGIPDAEERLHAYPYQFSGGMRQRVMIAMTLMLDPKLIIADEPTTALDVTIQAQIFELILQMKRRDTAILFITHDMGVIWELCDRVLVMKDARLVESGAAEPLFQDPRDPYTRKLLAAVPRLTDRLSVKTPCAATSTEPSATGCQPDVVRVEDVRTWFPVRRGIWARTTGHVKAVDGVTVRIPYGHTYGLVGESGSGKTTLGRSILGLDPLHAGTVYFKGTPVSGLSSRRMQPYRRHLQMVFQDPFSSLNPRLNVLDIITEAPYVHRVLKSAPEELAAYWLKEVGLSPDMMYRYPHEFSGGQRQRICIARAMALEPAFMVCDEAVSALDVTVQAQIIDLLMQLKEKYALSYLFISHDLSVVRRIADYVGVMRAGRLVEEGTVDRVIDDPQDAYTRRLIAAVPVPGDPQKRRQRIHGAV